MYCLNCGKEITEDSKFCKWCGSNVDIELDKIENTKDSKDKRIVDCNINWRKFIQYSVTGFLIYIVLLIIITDNSFYSWINNIISGLLFGFAFGLIIEDFLEGGTLLNIFHKKYIDLIVVFIIIVMQGLVSFYIPKDKLLTQIGFNNAQEKKTTSNSIINVSNELSLDPKAKLEKEIVECAHKFRKVKSKYKSMEYDLKYKTLSSNLNSKAEELQRYAQTEYTPIAYKFSSLLSTYADRNGSAALRDLAVKNDFLDLLR